MWRNCFGEHERCDEMYCYHSFSERYTFVWKKEVEHLTRTEQRYEVRHVVPKIEKNEF